MVSPPKRQVRYRSGFIFQLTSEIARSGQEDISLERPDIVVPAENFGPAVFISGDFELEHTPVRHIPRRQLALTTQ